MFSRREIIIGGIIGAGLGACGLVAAIDAQAAMSFGTCVQVMLTGQLAVFGPAAALKKALAHCQSQCNKKNYTKSLSDESVEHDHWDMLPGVPAEREELDEEPESDQDEQLDAQATQPNALVFRSGEESPAEDTTSTLEPGSNTYMTRSRLRNLG